MVNLREWVYRDRVRAGASECNTSFFSLVLESVVNIFVFVGSVTVSNRVN